MATYKVIQDIESEDKLIGPFGIRQFVYLIIVAVSGFVIFKIVVSGVWYLAIPFLPHTLFFALLALPFGGDQQTETWLLAKIRFMIKPRKRVWDQTGAQNLVTITAPKREERPLTHNLSEGEVRSRLQALANTLDSRGWAVKNLNINVFTPAYATASPQSTDRLVDISQVQPPPDDTVPAIDDMLDEQNNRAAQNLTRMIDESSKSYRTQLISNMKNTVTQPQPASAPDMPEPVTQPDYWFMSQNGATNPAGGSMGAIPSSSTLVMPDPTAAQTQSQGLALQPLAPTSDPLTEEELLEKIHTEKQHKPKPHGNLKVIKTLDEQRAEAEEAARQTADAKQSELEQKVKAAAAEPAMTSEPNPDIIKLARNNDLSVETVARQAKKSKEGDLSEDEVVIQLH